MLQLFATVKGSNKLLMYSYFKYVIVMLLEMYKGSVRALVV